MRGFFERHFKLGIVTVAVFFMAIGFALSLFVVFRLPSPPVTALTDTPVEKPPVMPVTTTANTKIYYVRRYTLSDSVGMSEETIDTSLIGLEAAPFAMMFEDWTVDSFTEEKVTLSRIYHSYGPGTFTLTTADDEGMEYLVVYSYDDEGSRQVYERLATPVENFESADLSRIRGGITVTGSDELDRLLENYSEGFE